MPYAELRVREISINDIVPPRPVSIFQRRPKTRNVYCRLIVVRDPTPPHGRPADAPASPPISATPSPGDVEPVPGAAPSSASSPPPPPTKMLEFKTPVVCGTLSPVFAMEDPRIAHEASLAQAITSPMDGEAAPPADSDAASPGPPSEATGGGKRRSLDQQFGPPPPLFSVPLDLDDVMNGNLRVEIWDDALGDLVGTATFSIRQIFELEFGLDEFCQIGDVEPTAALLADEAKRRRSALCSWSWCHTTNADRPAPLPPTSPASIRRPALNVMMGADMDATTRSPQTDAFKYGCVRIFARAMSPTYIVDMLSSADVASVMAGFQVVLHIVQYSDPQDLMRNLKAGDDEITPPPALIRVLQRDVFEAMFAAPTRFRNDESTSALSRVSVYRQLSHKLWIVLDTGTARFGNAFAASLYHFGGQLAKLTDLDMMTPTICLSVLEMIARLDPGPRMDALSSDDGVAISNLIRLVDPDHPQAPLIAESIQVRAMQLLTTFAVQVDLPFSWRLSYARRLSAQSIDRILAYHLVEHADTDLAVDALDLCMALTTVVDEIVETYRGMSPLTTPGSSGSEPAAALKDVRTSILQRAKLARDDRPPPMTTISDSDEKNGDNLSPRHRGMDLERPALMPARRSITRQSSFPVLPVGRDKPATQTGGPASGTKDASSCELVSAVAVAAAQITTSSSPNQRKLIQKKQSAVLTRAASVTSETIAAAAPDSFRHRSWSILKGGDIRATDDETKQALRLMEQKAAAIGSENARLVQRILFTEDFGLERLRLSLNACRGAGPRPNLSSALFPLANMTEARLPQGRSCKGYDVNVHCEFVLGPERERFAVTHVIVAVGDQSRQLRTDVAAMALYLTEEPILHDLKPAGFGDLRAHALLQDEDKRGANSESQQPQHQQQHSHHHHHQQQQQQNVDRAPVFAIDLRPHRFVEIILPKEHTGRFLTLTLNPSSKAEGTGGFVSVDFVAFVGWPLGASAPPRASRRRPHLQLIGNVAYHVSINVPMDGGDLVQLEESRRHAARFRDAEHNNSGAGSAASSGAAAQ